MYLFKFLPNAGICSRRKAAELIKAKKIKINGKIVDDLYYVVNKNDTVQFGDNVINIPEYKYILLNKPKDYICTVFDPSGRKTILDLVKDLNVGKVYPIGRLDRMTTGLIILTNDGDLTQKLSHPKYEISKGYEVVLDKPLKKDDFELIKNGLNLDDGFIFVDNLFYIPGQKGFNLGIEIHSGRNRIVRRIFEHLGYSVKKLDRVYYAGLQKTGLRLGKWRFLTKKEVDYLKGLGDESNFNKKS